MTHGSGPRRCPWCGEAGLPEFDGASFLECWAGRPECNTPEVADVLLVGVAAERPDPARRCDEWARAVDALSLIRIGQRVAAVCAACLPAAEDAARDLEALHRREM